MKPITLTPTTRERAIEEVRRAPDGHRVTIEEETRNVLQNQRLHAMLNDISKQVKHEGLSFNVTVWKRLCTAAYLRTLNESPILVPALDGHGIDIIYEKTSKMSVKKMSGLIEWVKLFGDSQQVEWSDPKLKYEE